MVELAPLLSSSSIPQMAKIGLSLFVSAAVFPTVLASHYPIPTACSTTACSCWGRWGSGC